MNVLMFIPRCITRSSCIVWVNHHRAELISYKIWRPKGVFQFEIIITVLLSSFRFIWIPMLWIYSRYKYVYSHSAGIDFRRQILTSKVDPRTVRVKQRDTIDWHNVGIMLVQRWTQWNNIKPALMQHLLSGKAHPRARILEQVTIHCRSGNILEVLIFANFASMTNSRI